MWREWPVHRIETEKRRLEVLRYLVNSGRYEAAATMLRMHCSRIGVPTSNDQIAAALAWLAEHELITVRGEGADPVARVTSDGRDVAEGLTAYPGVLRPDP